MKIFLSRAISPQGKSRAYEVLARAWKEATENPSQLREGWGREIVRVYPQAGDLLESLLWLLHEEHEGRFVFSLSEEEWEWAIGELDYLYSKVEGDSSGPTLVRGLIDLSEERTVEFEVTGNPQKGLWGTDLNQEGNVHFLVRLWQKLERRADPKLELGWTFVPRAGFNWTAREILLARAEEFKLPYYGRVVLTLGSEDFYNFLAGSPARW